MKKKILSYVICMIMLFSLIPNIVQAEMAYSQSVVFMASSPVVIVDDIKSEKLINKDIPYISNGMVNLSDELAKKYFNEELNNKTELQNASYNVYESERFGFLAVGDIDISVENEEDIAKKFGIYVSVDGSDRNTGYANAPKATLASALSVYADLSKNSQTDYTNDIFIHAGTYRILSTINITSAHGGVNITDFGDGEVIISGAEKLNNAEFQKVTDESILSKVGDKAKENLYSVDLTKYFSTMSPYTQYEAQADGRGYYDLYADKQMKTLARWPNAGFVRTGKIINDTTFDTMQNRAKKWGNSNYAMVWGYWKYDWAGQPIYINSVDDQTYLTLSKPPLYGIDENMRYYAFNMLEELDIPGEYYIDIDNKILYYYPDGDISKQNLEITSFGSLLFNISNASNIKLSNMTVEMSRFAGIYTTLCNNAVLSNVTVRNHGDYGIAISGTNCTVENSQVYNLGGAGILASGGDINSLTRGNTVVRNNHIYNFGRTFRTYKAGIALNGCGNSALYNTIHDCPHMAISFAGTNSMIANNEIYDVVKECSDAGAIYSGRNWTSWGRTVRNNYFHDIKRNNETDVSGVACVYVDDMMCGTTVYENVFENCDLAMLAGGGWANSFHDNTLINCKKSIQYDNRAQSGNWANASVLPGGVVYENFIKFIESNSNIALWEITFEGFKELKDMAEVQKNQSDDEENKVDLGIPRFGMVYGNRNYGSNVNDDKYYEIAQSVIENGTILTDDEVKSIETPQEPINFSYGADNTSINETCKIIYPDKGEEINDSVIKLIWEKVSGYSNYSVSIKSAGVEIYAEDTKNNYIDVTGLKNGTYDWSVTAYDVNNQNIIASSKFTVNRKVDIIEGVCVENFDEYNDVVMYIGTETSKTYILGNYLTITVEGEGNIAEIAVDPYTNSKALKLTYTGTGKIEVHNWFTGNSKQINLSSTQNVRAGYKARIEHYASNAFLYRFNAFTNKNDWYGIARIHGYGNTLILNRGGFYNVNSNILNDGYFSSEMLYNSDNQYTKVTTNGVEMIENTGGTKQPVARASFVISEASGGFQGGMTGNYESYYGKGDPSENTVVWLDDLEFELLDQIEVKESSKNENNKMYYNTNIVNYKNTDVNFDYCVALYKKNSDGSERMVGVKVARNNTASALGKGNIDLNFTFDVSENDSYYCKGLLWKSIDSMIPIKTK